MGATKRDALLHQELNDKQHLAINALITGATDQEAADAAGVHRVTVSRWRLYHPGFRAELNRRRNEVWGASHDKLRALLPKAIGRLERELENPTGDWRSAAKVLELVGIGPTESPPSDLPTAPEDVLRQDLAERQQGMFESLAASGLGDPDRYARQRDNLIEAYKQRGAFSEE